MDRKRVVVVCPGRGSYTRETSNYLSNSLPEMDEFIKTFDSRRAAENLIKISELDKTTKFNTYLRLKNTYLPDKEGKVFAIYSEK